jgi:hypothetical protein
MSGCAVGLGDRSPAFDGPYSRRLRWSAGEGLAFSFGAPCLVKSSSPRCQPRLFKRLSARRTAASVAGRAQTLFEFLFEDSGGFLHFRFSAAVLDGAEEGDDEVKYLAVAGPLFWGDCHGQSGFIVLVMPQLG